MNLLTSGRPDRSEFDSVTWEDVQWLMTITDLPVIVKGILRPEDAVMAIDVGCNGVWVSNHGARVLDTVPSTVSSKRTWVDLFGPYLRFIYVCIFCFLD